MSHRAASANLIWFGMNLAGHLRFERALGRVRETQEQVLRRYLRRNQDTVIGRELGFSRIGSLDEYRERVPISRYEDYVEPIDRIAAGEEEVLTREPVRLFQPTAGSTSGAKWIPYTDTLQAELRKAVAPWVFDLFRRKPALLGGPAYWSISPAMREVPTKPSVVPVGFEDDASYLGSTLEPLVAATLAVPSAVRSIQDIDVFRRATLLWLLNARELRLISVWHPSFLALLMAPLRERWGEFVRDVETGFSLAEPRMDIPPNRPRARELSSLAAPSLSQVWPRLRLISCWGDGHAAAHCAELEELFPGVEVQHKGLLATEAVVSIPFEDRRPLAVTSHFFEFLDPAGRPLAAWELEAGGVYSLLVTTGGGLYRYRLMDRVEVTGFLQETPCLRFLEKEDQVSDMCGEKLGQGFVGAAIDRALARVSIRPRFAMLAPERTNGGTRYVLFVETTEPLPVGVAAVLEDALRENPHYDYCVRLGQLGPLRVLETRENAYRRYVTRLAGEGRRLGDVKPSPLSTLTGWSQVFLQDDPRRV